MDIDFSAMISGTRSNDIDNDDDAAKSDTKLNYR